MTVIHCVRKRSFILFIITVSDVSHEADTIQNVQSSHGNETLNKYNFTRDQVVAYRNSVEKGKLLLLLNV